MPVTFKKLGQYGGFANGLFECAAAIGYAKKYNLPFIFPKWKYSKYINLSDEYFDDVRYINSDQDYIEPNYSYKEIPFMGRVNLHGYFQSWKYFDNCREYIKEVLSPVEPEDYNMFSGMCSIHVRRQDYLKYQDSHPVLGMDYYERAMDLVPCNKFIVFSDDVKWCRENFKDSRVQVSDQAPDYVDFKFMTASEHSIIANSTFSWWAAYLGQDEKTVIAPKNWFGPALAPTHPTSDLILPNWTLI